MNLKQTFYNLLYSFGLNVKLVKPENNLWLTELGIEAVLDIGANDGDYARRISQILPEAQIYSFEPIPSCYQQLLEKTKALKIIAFPFALGEKEEELSINVSAHSPSSSLLGMATLHEEMFEGSGYVKSEMIIVKRLDDIAIQLNLKKKYLVKIDVQGFEDKVIKGGIETIRHASIIIIETSFQELYKGQMLFGEIHDLLQSLGFRFGGNLSQAKFWKDGSFLYADSVFFNRSLESKK
jgi:FkbM family methyltransferase